MKVLILSQYFWPETFRINEVARSLRDVGAEVCVLTGKPNYPEGEIFEGHRAWGLQREAYHDIPVFRVPMAPRGRGSALGLAWNYLSFVIAASIFGPWLLRGRKFDAIVVYGISPILQGIAAIAMKAFKRCPVALWVQDLWPQSLEATGFVRNRRALKAVEHVVRAIYRYSDVLLVQSPAFVEEVATLSDRRKIVYHPNPGELAFEACRTDVGRPDDRPPAEDAKPAVDFAPGFNVLFAGNLGTAQAVETIIETAYRLRDHERIRFVLVGNGSRSDWIREETARLGLHNVEMPGRFAPEAMPGILNAASVLLVTLARRDIFRLTVPSKVQAYLAAGKPILAALEGEGARVVAESGAGVIVPPEDAESLARAVLEMSAMPPRELDNMGRRGRAYYHSHFSPSFLAGRLLNLLEKATNEYRRAGHARRTG